MALYDSIGHGYSKSRPVDHRILRGLIDAMGLKTGSTLIDVGAGTGKYSVALAEEGFNLIAIEPSEVMRSQAIHHPRVKNVASFAESIPLASNSAHGAIMVLSLHHFSDRVKAIHEVLRIVGNGPLVIFTFEPSKLCEFWLTDYFPSLGRENGSSFSRLASVAAEVESISRRRIHCIPFPLPRDLEDKFGAAGWATPECYLDTKVRSGISSFSLMSDYERGVGLRRLDVELKSGEWDRKYGFHRNLGMCDVGYHYIVCAEES